MLTSHACEQTESIKKLAEFSNEAQRVLIISNDKQACILKPWNYTENNIIGSDGNKNCAC